MIYCSSTPDNKRAGEKKNDDNKLILIHKWILHFFLCPYLSRSTFCIMMTSSFYNSCPHKIYSCCQSLQLSYIANTARNQYILKYTQTKNKTCLKGIAVMWSVDLFIIIANEHEHCLNIVR